MVLSKGPEDLICSTRDCTAAAEFAFIWSNPKIHTGREKVWLACPNHKDYLENYVKYRNFPVRVIDISDLE